VRYRLLLLGTGENLKNAVGIDWLARGHDKEAQQNPCVSTSYFTTVLCDKRDLLVLYHRRRRMKRRKTNDVLTEQTLTLQQPGCCIYCCGLSLEDLKFKTGINALRQHKRH
jgi:alpha-glucuronidase